MSQVFFPLTRWLGVEPESQLSPALAVKVIHAASASTASFEEASANLSALAEAEVSPKRISRLADLSMKTATPVLVNYWPMRSTMLPIKKTE